MPGAIHCWAHDPTNAAQRARTASRAGKSGGRGRRGTELPEIKDQLKDMLSGVLSGDILPGVAAIACQVQNTRLRVIEVERRLRETQDLLERIEVLEASAATAATAAITEAAAPQRLYGVPQRQRR